MYSFLRVGAAVPVLNVADCKFNTSTIIDIINKANEKKVKVLVFPELSLTGYTCGELFMQSALIDSCEGSLTRILNSTKDNDMLIIIGAPINYYGQLFNCGVIIHKGDILGVVPKSFLPNYKEFYEKRWFSSGCNVKGKMINICGTTVPFGSDLLFECDNFKDLIIGIEICEDLWAVIPPSSYQSMCGASVICNLSASNELVAKDDYRRKLVSSQSARCVAAYVYSSAGIYESTTDLVFSGHSIICENGNVLTESERFHRNSQLIYQDVDVEALLNERRVNTTFAESLPKDVNFRSIYFALDVDQQNKIEIARTIPSAPFVPSNSDLRDKNCEDIFKIQICGLAKRFNHINAKKLVLGVSGGLDSTLALLTCVKTCDYLNISRDTILGVTMPGFGTTEHTYNNAVNLMKALNVPQKEISIKDACIQHFKDIEHDIDLLDVTFENVQARERTQILMDLANKENGILVGTGNLSELALGYATYNGDHMSMYAVNSSIPKTLIRFIIGWVIHTPLIDNDARDILIDIIKTPISPELLPPDKQGLIKQKTEETVGPYELQDFFIFHCLRHGFNSTKIAYLAGIAFNGKYSNEEISKWLDVFYKRFFTQQFKRSCMPDGPKVGSVSLSPRGDWKMPSDASYNGFL